MANNNEVWPPGFFGGHNGINGFIGLPEERCRQCRNQSLNGRIKVELVKLGKRMHFDRNLRFQAQFSGLTVRL